MSNTKVHPVFPGKSVPVRKKAPPSRKSEAIATHAAPGVNGHGNHGTHGTQPNPKSFLSLHPHTFSGEVGGRGNTVSGAGLRGSVLSVDSVADLGWGGRATLSLQSLAPKFPEEPFFFRFLRLFFRLPVPFPFHGQ